MKSTKVYIVMVLVGMQTMFDIKTNMRLLFGKG